MSTTDDRLRDHFHRAASRPAADEALLDALRADAHRRRRRRRSLTAGLAAVAATAAAVLGVAVTSTDEKPEEVDVVSPTTSTTSAAAPAARDWDGVRFDFGRIERVHRDGEQWLVEFDRTQLEGRSGHDFTEEPVVVGNTDEPTVNENRRLRTYAFRPDAEALVVANLLDTCSDKEQPKPALWSPLTFEELADPERWDDYTQVSITFDPEGLVMRIRLSRGC